MKITVLKLTAKGEFVITWIRPDVEDLRHLLGGAVDNVKLFTDVQSFILRTSENHELQENVYVSGIYGDIVFTGGYGSYLADLSASKMAQLVQIFKGEVVSDGKA